MVAKKLGPLLPCQLQTISRVVIEQLMEQILMLCHLEKYLCRKSFLTSCSCHQKGKVDGGGAIGTRAI